jgi:putative protein-disulfide isomerase
MTMTSPVLHYIHDPLCGWCYGAAPLVRAARAVLPVVAHGGGMMAGANRQAVSPQLRAYVLPHDQRIAQLTGQLFGDAYRDGLLNDSTAMLDSEPPITAMLAAEQLTPGLGLDLLARLQAAHYQQGRRIADLAVLADEAQALGLDRAAFLAAYAACSGAPTQAHMRDSRQLLAEVGGQGFPCLVLDSGEQRQVVDLGRFLGQPAAWTAWLTQTRDNLAPAPASALPFCSPDGCAL